MNIRPLHDRVIVKRIEETVAKVQREPAPDPYKEDWCALASKHLSETHEEQVK